MGEWPRGACLLAAVSGGADSTALLNALASLRKDRGLGLRCLHVDHGIRSAEESRGDAEAVRDLCRSLRVPLRIITVASGLIQNMAKSRGIGVEAAARLVRHRAWNREARRVGAVRVLVGHTRDDLLETALMRVLRGSGPAGLAIMPRSRGLIVRPLLDLDRAQVLEYLKNRGLSYRTDSTNADLSYLRNRIRHKLMPLLDEWFPFWRSSLISMAETQRYTAEFLREEAEGRLPWESLLALDAAPDDSGKAASLEISRELFFNQPEILREEALFLAADRLRRARRKKRGHGDAPDGSRENRSSIPRRLSVRLFCQGKGARDLGPLGAAIQGDRIILSSRKERQGEEGFSLLIKKPGLYKIEGIGLELQAPGQGTGDDPGGFSVALPLVFRRSHRDDRIESWIGGSGSFSRKKALTRSRLWGYTDIIAAEDIQGVAAFIGIKRGKAVLISRRTEKGLERGFYCRISVGNTGGLHGAE